MRDALLVAVPVAAAGTLLVRGRFWPYGPCPACSGRRGRGRGSRPKSYNRCGRCGGKGERVRPLARIWPRWNTEAKRLAAARKQKGT